LRLGGRLVRLSNELCASIVLIVSRLLTISFVITSPRSIGHDHGT
jgi:hypothetical protein